MTRKIYTILSILLIVSFALAACGAFGMPEARTAPS